MRARVAAAIALAALCAVLAPGVAAVVVVGRVYRPVVAAPFGALAPARPRIDAMRTSVRAHMRARAATLCFVGVRCGNDEEPKKRIAPRSGLAGGPATCRSDAAPRLLCGTVGGLTTVAPSGVFYRRPSVVVVGRKLQAAQQPCKTVAQVLKQTPSLSALSGVSDRLSASLKTELTSSAGAAFTFFAPSDRAITSLLSSLPNNGASLVTNETALTALLSYHLVPGAALAAADLKDGQQLATALKGAPPLRMRLADGGVLIVAVGSEAAVVQPDIKTCRGVVHVVDTVLLPIMGSGDMAQQG
jgi:uncharacterized surface protein with fasciclin (FAS1) repeats